MGVQSVGVKIIGKMSVQRRGRPRIGSALRGVGMVDKTEGEVEHKQMEWFKAIS